MKEELRGIYP